MTFADLDSFDHLGAGYSPLSCVKRYPISQLKIDPAEEAERLLRLGRIILP